MRPSRPRIATKNPKERLRFLANAWGRRRSSTRPHHPQHPASDARATPPPATVEHVTFDENSNDPADWTFDVPRLGPASELLTLALLEDVSALLVLHGYAPLRGYALAEVTLCLQRIQTP